MVREGGRLRVPRLAGPMLNAGFSTLRHSPHLLHVKETRRERRGRPRSILTPGRGGEVEDEAAASEAEDAGSSAEEDDDDTEASGVRGLESLLSPLGDAQMAALRGRRRAAGVGVAAGRAHAAESLAARAGRATTTTAIGRGRVAGAAAAGGGMRGLVWGASFSERERERAWRVRGTGLLWAREEKERRESDQRQQLREQQEEATGPEPRKSPLSPATPSNTPDIG